MLRAIASAAVAILIGVAALTLAHPGTSVANTTATEVGAAGLPRAGR